MENTFLLAQTPADFLLVFGYLIGLTIGAFFLQLATKWVCGIKLSYGAAFGYNFLTTLVSMMIGFVVGFCIGFCGAALRLETLQITAMILPGMATILLCPLLLGSLIRNQEGRSIGYGRGFLVLIVQSLLGIGVVAAVLVVCIVLANL